MIRQIYVLLVIGVLSLSACSSSNKKPPEPQTDQAMLQATIDALQATVDASDSSGAVTQPPTEETTLVAATTSQPTPPPPVVSSLADRLIGDWRIYDTYRDGCISRMSGNWKACGLEDGTIGFLKGFVFGTDGRFYDPGMEEFFTYEFSEQERQLLLQYPNFTESFRVIDITDDSLKISYEDEPLEEAVEFVRYGAGVGEDLDVTGLWYFEPNEFNGFLPRIFLDREGRFFAWFVNDSGKPEADYGGRYEPFTDDVWLLPGAPWQDSINGPPTLHIEEIDGDRGHFSFPEVDTETGFNATRVREDEELAKKLEGRWSPGGDPEYELEFGTEWTGGVFGITGEYIFRAFEDSTIGLFATEQGRGFILWKVTFEGSDNLSLTCPVDGQSTSELRLQRAK